MDVILRDPVYEELSSSEEGWLELVSGHVRCRLIDAVTRTKREHKLTLREFLTYSDVRFSIRSSMMSTNLRFNLDMLVGLFKAREPELHELYQHYLLTTLRRHIYGSDLTHLIIERSYEVVPLTERELSSEHLDEHVMAVRRVDATFTRKELITAVVRDYDDGTLDGATSYESWSALDLIGRPSDRFVTPAEVIIDRVASSTWDVRDVDAMIRLVTLARQAADGCSDAREVLRRVIHEAGERPMYSIDVSTVEV